jgi:lysophospholipase L1-like esterase
MRRAIWLTWATVGALTGGSAWGWGLVTAEVKDPKLPRVLLIGDSIVGGYRYAVARQLEGKVTVDIYGNPYNQANNNWHAELKSILSSNGPYAVIHFNLGLHGWRKGDIPEGKFETLTAKCVETIRQGTPEARIIWASTTPVVTTNRPYALDPEVNPVIVDHNARAARVMQTHGIPVNDLYTLIRPHVDLSHGDRFHWQGEAYALMGQAVARAIEAQLRTMAVAP